MLAEFKRLISNLIAVGTITQVRSLEGKALARVKVMDMETDWLPVASLSNTFKKHWIPVRVKEQCIVLRPFGDSSSGFIIRSIFSRGAKEPSGADANTEIIEYSDGTRLKYSTSTGHLSIDCVGSVTIKAQSVIIEAPTKIIGDLAVEGAITTGGNITAGGVITDSDGNGGA